MASGAGLDRRRGVARDRSVRFLELEWWRVRLDRRPRRGSSVHTERSTQWGVLPISTMVGFMVNARSMSRMIIGRVDHHDMDRALTLPRPADGFVDIWVVRGFRLIVVRGRSRSRVPPRPVGRLAETFARPQLAGRGGQLALVDRLASPRRSVIVPMGGSKETDFKTRWGQFSIPSCGATSEGMAPLSLGVQRSHTLRDCPHHGTPICV